MPPKKKKLTMKILKELYDSLLDTISDVIQRINTLESTVKKEDTKLMKKISAIIKDVATINNKENALADKVNEIITAANKDTEKLAKAERMIKLHEDKFRKLKNKTEVNEAKIEELQDLFKRMVDFPRTTEKEVTQSTPTDSNAPIPISIPGLEPDIVEAINVFKLPSGEIRVYTKRKLATPFWKRITNILKDKGFTWHSVAEKEEWYWTDKPEPEDTQPHRRNNGRRSYGRRRY